VFIRETQRCRNDENALPQRTTLDLPDTANFVGAFAAAFLGAK
jgi:hypothetical protein